MKRAGFNPFPFAIAAALPILVLFSGAGWAQTPPAPPKPTDTSAKTAPPPAPTLPPLPSVPNMPPLPPLPTFEKGEGPVELDPEFSKEFLNLVRKDMEEILKISTEDQMKEMKKMLREASEASLPPDFSYTIKETGRPLIAAEEATESPILPDASPSAAETLAAPRFPPLETRDGIITSATALVGAIDGGEESPAVSSRDGGNRPPPSETLPFQRAESQGREATAVEFPFERSEGSPSTLPEPEILEGSGFPLTFVLSLAILLVLGGLGFWWIKRL